MILTRVDASAEQFLQRRCISRAYEVGTHYVYDRHSTLCNIPSVDKKNRNEVQIAKYRT